MRARLALLLIVTLGAAVWAVTAEGDQARRRAAATAAPQLRAVPTGAARTAAWCAEASSRDRGAVAPGPSIHVVYAFPFDGENRFEEQGRLIAADVAAIERWWRGEDQGRVPRFDRYDAPCGRQLDISVARLDDEGRSYARYAVIGDLVDTEISLRGFDRENTLYVVYYDGPTGLTDVCGEGAGDPRLGVARALVYLGACGELDRARIVAHEIVHALGTLPEGALHPCDGDTGHPCDSDADILWPKVDARRLAEVRLDVGRDDYYRHGGAWWDARDSLFLRRLDEQGRLVVDVQGSGTVSSTLPGVRPCAGRCVTRFDGPVTVWLRPKATAGRRFLRWEGACAGRRCVLDLDGNRATVKAVFTPL